MKQYKIFKHPSGAIETVKQGWSWPAFFFTFIWVFVKKMWKLGVGAVAAFFILGIVLGIAGVDIDVNYTISNILGIIIAIVLGMKGNDLREKNILSRGYTFKDTVTASNADGATALFFTNQHL